MGATASPLRYPGGKSSLYPLIAQILRVNNFEHRQYVEPFAGGCGLALDLLYGGHVCDIHINDIDPGVWAFWESALNHTRDLTQLIERTPVTIDQWHRQRSIFSDGSVDDPLTLGFATFFLNRTNRSGVIKQAGAIGGQNQTGHYKIDCRFNREVLVRRVRRVAKYRSRIHLSRLDALNFIQECADLLPSPNFFYVDPPYCSKGSKLYTNFYGLEDHANLASLMLCLDNPWVVTYDNEPDIKRLYRGRRHLQLEVNYSLETKRVGTELLIPSKGLRVGGFGLSRVSK